MVQLRNLVQKDEDNRKPNLTSSGQAALVKWFRQYKLYRQSMSESGLNDVEADVRTMADEHLLAASLMTLDGVDEVYTADNIPDDVLLEMLERRMTTTTPKSGIKFVDTFREMRMKRSIPEAAARGADYGAQFARLVKEHACHHMFEGAQGQKLKVKLLLRGISPDELRETVTEITETSMKELRTDSRQLLKLVGEKAVMFDEVRHYQKMVAAKEASRTRQSKKDERSRRSRR